MEENTNFWQAVGRLCHCRSMKTSLSKLISVRTGTLCLSKILMRQILRLSFCGVIRMCYDEPKVSCFIRLVGFAPSGATLLVISSVPEGLGRKWFMPGQVGQQAGHRPPSSSPFSSNTQITGHHREVHLVFRFIFWICLFSYCFV